MKIPRPQGAEKSFQRTRAPPSQATKLLLSSMSAALILIVVLAVVFIPRALQQEGNPAIPQIGLVVSSVSGTAWANVSKATVAARLADYNASVVRDVGSSTVLVGALAELASGASDGGVSFRDVDGDGLLSIRDSFTVATTSGGAYALYIWYKPEGKLVGVAQWTG